MSKHTKKFIAAVFLSTFILTGVVQAASNQFANVVLQTGASYATSDNINGNPYGEYGGALNSQRGSMLIEAMRVRSLYPDQTISSFITNSTNITSYGINMDPDDDLYYVKLSPHRNAPNGAGFIQNY